MKAIVVCCWAVFFLSALSFSVLSSPGRAFASDVTVCQTDKSKYQYRIELANLLLSKTAFRYGPSKIVSDLSNKEDPTQDRCVSGLMSGSVDLVYLPPTTQRLEDMNAIRIDIHNGMLGYRVFIIDKKNIERFFAVKSLEDLRKFVGEFGSQWVDFEIFTLNDFPVVSVARTEKLMKMLEIGRFDYFHRGLNESWAEIEEYKAQYPSLMIEETIALVYDLPVYLMFNKTNLKLKERFELGFEIILKDGSFRSLFKKHFGYLDRTAGMEKRTLIRIKYPGPVGLPAIDTHLWLK